MPPIKCHILNLSGTALMTNSLAITLENFQQVVLEESKTKLVLVDFGAQQIPESLELRDKLASLLASHGDTILFATVDCGNAGANRTAIWYSRVTNRYFSERRAAT